MGGGGKQDRDTWDLVHVCGTIANVARSAHFLEALPGHCLPLLVDLLRHDNQRVVAMALKVLANVATGDDGPTQARGCPDALLRSFRGPSVTLSRSLSVCRESPCFFLALSPLPLSLSLSRNLPQRQHIKAGPASLRPLFATAGQPRYLCRPLSAIPQPSQRPHPTAPHPQTLVSAGFVTATAAILLEGAPLHSHECLVDACWALGNVAAGTREQAQVRASSQAGRAGSLEGA
jgi:hypothetical protein